MSRMPFRSPCSWDSRCLNLQAELHVPDGRSGAACLTLACVVEDIQQHHTILDSARLRICAPPDSPISTIWGWVFSLKPLFFSTLVFHPPTAEPQAEPGVGARRGWRENFFLSADLLPMEALEGGITAKINKSARLPMRMGGIIGNGGSAKVFRAGSSPLQIAQVAGGRSRLYTSPSRPLLDHNDQHPPSLSYCRPATRGRICMDSQVHGVMHGVSRRTR